MGLYCRSDADEVNLWEVRDLTFPQYKQEIVIYLELDKFQLEEGDTLLL